jgi:hypothetical protein
MRFVILAATLLAAPVFAADTPVAMTTAVVAHEGDMLRDANNVRLSAIDTVNRDGSVGIIYNGHVVTVPGSTLATANGKLVTSLTKAQLSAM